MSVIIYVDKKQRCHAEPADDRTPYDLQFFDGAAPGVIECYEYRPATKTIAEQIKAVERIETIDAFRRQHELDEAAHMEELAALIEEIYNEDMEVIG